MAGPPRYYPCGEEQLLIPRLPSRRASGQLDWSADYDCSVCAQGPRPPALGALGRSLHGLTAACSPCLLFSVQGNAGARSQDMAGPGLCSP